MAAAAAAGPVPIEVPAVGVGMERLQLEDYIYVYPDVDVPDIQGLITAKKEFNELGALLREPVPNPGQFYRHQKEFHRLLRAYDFIFNLSDTGTGKSCAFIGAAEYFKQHSKIIDRVYVLEKGPTIINDFKHQIMCTCTAGEYETKIVREASRETTRKANITRELKKWYSVMTYRAFAAEVGDATDEDIINRYSGCLFMVDEAHNLRGESKEEKAALSRVYDVLWKVFHLIKRSKVVISTATPMINDVNEIPRIANLILPADRQLPPGRLTDRKTNPLEWDYRFVTLAQMEPFFRGRVAFVRGLDTGAVQEHMGVPRTIIDAEGTEVLYEHDMEIPDPTWVAPPFVPDTPQPMPPTVVRKIPTQTVTWNSYMVTREDILADPELASQPNLDIQDQIYLNATVASAAFHATVRQAGTFVFPDGSIAGKFPRAEKNAREAAARLTEGLGKYVLSTRPDQYTTTPELLPWLTNLKYLRCLSCKFATIVDIEMKSPGCGFVFSEFVAGAGAILLGQCFEAQKWVRFEETTSCFTTISAEEGSVCTAANTTRVVRANFPPRPRGQWRFALLTSETPDTKIASMLEMFNSPENMDGDYIKLIIGSPVSRDGINLFNVLRGHLLMAGWHPSGTYQALNRFLRATSHEALMKRLREEYIQEGKDPATASIEVQVYRHASIASTGDSIDLQLYLGAEDKDLYIRRMLRFLKQIAVDCQIHYSRNVRPAAPGVRGDVDGSAACDYDVCEYTCVGPTPVLPQDIDFSTYDILYSDDVVAACVADLVTLLRERSSVTLPELRALWITPGIYREKFVYMAIDKLLTDKRQLLNRYAYGCYFQTNGFTVYTQREFPTRGAETSGQPELSIYGEHFIGVSTSSFDAVVTIYQGARQDRILEALWRLTDPEGTQSAEFNVFLDRLSLESKVQLLEDAITSESRDENIPLYGAVYNRLSAYVFYTPEPADDLATAAAAMSGGASRRLAITYVGPPEQGTLLPDGTEVPIVYIHRLYSSAVGLTSYAVTAKFSRVSGKGRLRLFNPREHLGWRDANAYEQPVYSHILQQQLDSRLQHFREQPVYGSIHEDKKFRIHDLYSEQAVGSDTRGKHRGEACTTWVKPNLMRLMTNLNILPDLINNIRLPDNMYRYMGRSAEGDDVWQLNRDAAITYLLGRGFTKDPATLRDVDDPTLEALSRWYVSKATRSYMCAQIQDYFTRNNMLLVT